MDTAEILRRFERHPDGHWVCTEPATIATAHGPLSVEPGQTFVFGERIAGLDLAEFLEQLGAQYGS